MHASTERRSCCPAEMFFAGAPSCVPCPVNHCPVDQGGLPIPDVLMRATVMLLCFLHPECNEGSLRFTRYLPPLSESPPGFHSKFLPGCRLQRSPPHRDQILPDYQHACCESPRQCLQGAQSSAGVCR